MIGFLDPLSFRLPPPAASRAQPWSEKFRFGDELLFDAATWTPFTLHEVPVVDLRNLQKGKRVGDMLYQHVRFPKGEWLQIAQGAKRGKVWFTDEVVIPRVCDVAKRVVPWMSYTPSEIVTQRAGLRMARGRVVVGGLGMGWLARRVAERPNVKEVLVVERSADVVGLVWDRVKTPKMALRVADVWEVLPTLDDEWTALLDVWEGYGDASGNTRLTAWRKARPGLRTWAWGEKAYDERRF